MQRPVGKRPTYHSLWREFLVFQSTARRLAHNKFHKTTGGMNVSTVFPEGFTGNERESVPQRRGSMNNKDDEEADERYNRKIPFQGARYSKEILPYEQ
ncbi:hypothetical protein KM043_015452 [Ampulex compressa]|nr:hypothetical protein KM043_015452 [Ampulex compressa]